MKNFYKRGKNFRENYITTLHKLFEYASTFYWKRKMSQFIDGTQVFDNQNISMCIGKRDVELLIQSGQFAH